MREYLTPLSRHVESNLSARDYKPSRLLADFYVLLGEQRGEEVVAERQIGLLYDSFLAAETDTLRVRLSIDSGDPDDATDELAVSEGEFELVYTASDNLDDEQVETRSFTIVEEKGEVRFLRQLKDASIVTRGSVGLGGFVDDFEIGPTVDIRCGKLQILSTGLVVRSGTTKLKDGEAVLLETSECDSRVTHRPVVRGSLAVRWPDDQIFPWTEFASPQTDDNTGAGDMHEIHRRFRRIVTSLRSHSKGSLARFKDKINHRRVLKNEVGRALLEKLLKDGILIAKGNFYHWSPDRADALLKVSWTSLRNRQVTPEMKNYFSRFVSENEALF